MFNRKPRRNFRQRQASSGDEEDQQKSSGDGEEDEKVAYAVNKPLKLVQGRGISCSSKREATPPKPDSSDGKHEETLEEESEREERRKDTDGGNNKINTVLSFSDEKEAEEPAFTLKKSSDKAVLFQVRKKEASHVKSPDRAVSLGGSVLPSNSPRQDYDGQTSPHAQQEDGDSGEDSSEDDSVKSGASSLASSSSDYSRAVNKPVIIPKAAEIQAARRQRHAIRTQKEFIPLGRDGHNSAASTPDRYSRDEDDDRDDNNNDDDDDELDDHERIIEFAPRLKSIRERIAEKLGGSEGSLSGTDGEEQDLWEETQIGKGVKRRPGGQSPSGSESSTGSSRRDRERQKKRSVRIRIPKIHPPVSVSLVKKRITGKLDSLKEVHRARQAELRRMEGDIESAKTSMETLEENSSESQLKFYRTMTVYVDNLVECLREKIVEINSLELELHTLLSDQMETLLAQRRQSIKEQADQMQQLSYGTDEKTNGAETQGEASVAAKAEEDTQDIPEDTQPSVGEEEQLQKNMADILSRSRAVFSDVQDDFCDVQKILSRFEEWRACYSDSYHSAYISLCLPKLLNPIIRHQLLAWNPLKDAYGDFEDLPWFTALETFCHGHGHEELDQTDRQTLSNVIEKTVLPKITAFVELVWDPMSRHQSVCLSDVCHRLKEDYSIFQGEQSKPVKALIEAVVRRLRCCVDEDVFIPLYPKRFLEDRLSPQCRFREQQFWMAIKLLGNMGKWGLLLPESVMKELMLDKLLNRYLMITLCSRTQCNNTVYTCKKIADSLPLSWFSDSLPQIQNFRNYLVETVHAICKRQPPEDPKTRSAVVEVLRVLSRIRCHDSIMAIAEKYHYEDVIYSHQLLNQETG